MDTATRKQNVGEKGDGGGVRQDSGAGASGTTTNVKGPCRYTFSASFICQTVDTPLPAIFAALWIECPPFNKRTMAHNTQMDRNPSRLRLYAPIGVRL